MCLFGRLARRWGPGVGGGGEDEQEAGWMGGRLQQRRVRRGLEGGIWL